MILKCASDPHPCNRIIRHIMSEMCTLIIYWDGVANESVNGLIGHVLSSPLTEAGVVHWSEEKKRTFFSPIPELWSRRRWRESAIFFSSSSALLYIYISEGERMHNKLRSLWWRKLTSERVGRRVEQSAPFFLSEEIKEKLKFWETIQ